MPFFVGELASYLGISPSLARCARKDRQAFNTIRRDVIAAGQQWEAIWITLCDHSNAYDGSKRSASRISLVSTGLSATLSKLGERSNPLAIQ